MLAKNRFNTIRSGENDPFMCQLVLRLQLRIWNSAILRQTFICSIICVLISLLPAKYSVSINKFLQHSCDDKSSVIQFKNHEKSQINLNFYAQTFCVLRAVLRDKFHGQHLPPIVFHGNADTDADNPTLS